MLKDKVTDAAFVVTISQYNRQVIIDECGSSANAKVVIIHCGVDTHTFLCDPARAGRANPLQFRVCCVGKLHEVKGQTYLIDACRVLADRGFQFVCHLVGDGPDRMALARRAARFDIRDRVHFHGWLTQEEVRRVLTEADVVVAPSVQDRKGSREGIPVALMEAMASGVPVVASRISGIPELVEDGVSGILVEPGDVQGLAAALQRLQEDEALRRRLADGARTRVEREFNLHSNATLLLERFLTSRTPRSRA